MQMDSKLSAEQARLLDELRDLKGKIRTTDEQILWECYSRAFRQTQYGLSVAQRDYRRQVQAILFDEAEARDLPT